jgi:ABC-type glycerol-3-phosphate transport system substrate-binding protein
MFALARNRSYRLRFATGLAGLMLLCLAGCGGAHKTTTGGGATGTPAGTSAVTVTATSASAGTLNTTTLNLTVQ